MNKEKPKSAAFEAVGLLERYGANFVDKVRGLFCDSLLVYISFKKNSLKDSDGARHVN